MIVKLIISALFILSASHIINAKPVKHYAEYNFRDNKQNNKTTKESLKNKSQPDSKYHRRYVAFLNKEKPGTIIIHTDNKFLYYLVSNTLAIRYGIGVGRDGFTWNGTVSIGRKKKWPDWYPPKAMINRQRSAGIILPAHMPGGINNPLGSRALYLYKQKKDTMYRIHGTNQPWTIGKNVSSGCIRMVNEDVEHLYKRAKIGSKVIVIAPGEDPGNIFITVNNFYSLLLEY